jgi:hypothetical protein
MQITKGEESITEFKPTEKVYRKFCNKCGSGVAQGPFGAPFVATYPTLYDDVDSRYPEGSRVPIKEFRPTFHCNMENSLMGDQVAGGFNDSAIIATRSLTTPAIEPHCVRSDVSCCS